MSNKILVAYATMNGSTAGVAEAIGHTLLERGLPVVVHRMEDVDELSPYSAVVAGSAIQEGRWLPEAMQFIQTHQAALRQKPFAAFLVCMTMAIKNGQYQDAVAEWLQPVRALIPPMYEGYFAGSLDIDKVPSLRQRLMFRMSVAFSVWSEGDHRDWAAIREWANGLADQLEPQFSKA